MYDMSVKLHGWGFGMQTGGDDLTYLNVSSIIVKSTNFPKSGTTNDVGGIISASSKKNTVNDSKMDMLNETCNNKNRNNSIIRISISIGNNSTKKVNEK